MHVVYDETNDLPSKKKKVIDDANQIERVKKLILKDSTINNEKEHEEDHDDDGEKQQAQGTYDLSREWRYIHNHLKKLIIDDSTHGIRTRSSLGDVNNYFAFVSHFEPKIIDEVVKNHN